MRNEDVENCGADWLKLVDWRAVLWCCQTKKSCRLKLKDGTGLVGCSAAIVCSLWLRCGVVLSLWRFSPGLVAVGATSGVSMVHALLWC